MVWKGLVFILKTVLISIKGVSQCQGGFNISTKCVKSNDLYFDNFIKECKLMNIILIMGAPGSGKSTYLKKLKKEGAFVLNDDDLRESVFGLKEPMILEKLYLLYIDILIDTLKNKIW